MPRPRYPHSSYAFEAPQPSELRIPGFASLRHHVLSGNMVNRDQVDRAFIDVNVVISGFEGRNQRIPLWLLAKKRALVFLQQASEAYHDASRMERDFYIQQGIREDSEIDDLKIKELPKPFSPKTNPLNLDTPPSSPSFFNPKFAQRRPSTRNTTPRPRPTPPATPPWLARNRHKYIKDSPTPPNDPDVPTDLDEGEMTATSYSSIPIRGPTPPLRSDVPLLPCQSKDDQGEVVVITSSDDDDDDDTIEE